MTLCGCGPSFYMDALHACPTWLHCICVPHGHTAWSYWLYCRLPAGESEAKLRQLFQDAADMAPCILFIGAAGMAPCILFIGAAVCVCGGGGP